MVAAFTPTTDPNMNGEYLLAPTPNGKNVNWSTQFKDYPGGVEYFEVYAGPVNSTYGEVFWTALPEVKLPEDIVKRFKGKGVSCLSRVSTGTVVTQCVHRWQLSALRSIRYARALVRTARTSVYRSTARTTT